MRIALAFSFFVFGYSPNVIAVRNKAIPYLQSSSVGWGLPRYRSQ